MCRCSRVRSQQLKAEPGKPVRMVWRQRHKDGHWMWLEGVATNLLDDPSVRAIVTNYRDITERLAHETRLAEQLQRLALLSRITHAIGERQDLRSIFQVVVARLEEELPVDFCGICLHDAGEHSLTVACIGARSEPTAVQLDMTHGTKVPIDENGLARCVRGQLVYEPDIAATPFPFPQRLASAGLGAMVIAPLLVESKVFGVLICARRPAQQFLERRMRVPAPGERTHRARREPGAAPRSAPAGLRRPAPDPAAIHAAGTAAGARPDGERHCARHQQCDLTRGAVHRGAARARVELSERARGYLEIIQRAVDDVAQTVARMGEFYRQREPQLSLVPVDLNKLVRQVVDLTRARWSDMALQRGVAIEMRLELAASLAPIAVAESQIRDALVNLVFNAVDAMPQGGVLTLRTRLADRRLQPIQQSSSRSVTPASAWTRKPGGAASNRSSRPRALAAPAWASRWSTASRSDTARRSNWKANPARARWCAWHSMSRRPSQPSPAAATSRPSAR